jgi:hypothetical protein
LKESEVAVGKYGDQGKRDFQKNVLLFSEFWMFKKKAKHNLKKKKQFKIQHNISFSMASILANRSFTSANSFLAVASSIK